MHERTEPAGDGRTSTGGLTGDRRGRPAAVTVDDARAAAQAAVDLVKGKLEEVVHTDR